MSDFDEWMAPRLAKIKYLLDQLEPYMKEYYRKDENGNTIVDMNKMKADADKYRDTFLAGTTPIMFDRKKDKKD